MKVGEVRSMDISSMKEKVVELKGELAKEKALVAGGTRPENPGNIKSIRKGIARILTVIKEKESESKSKAKKVKKEVN